MQGVNSQEAPKVRDRGDDAEIFLETAIQGLMFRVASSVSNHSIVLSNSTAILNKISCRARPVNHDELPFRSKASPLIFRIHAPGRKDTLRDANPPGKLDLGFTCGFSCCESLPKSELLVNPKALPRGSRNQH
jgi:hypothetical protein